MRRELACRRLAHHDDRSLGRAVDRTALQRHEREAGGDVDDRPMIGFQTIDEHGNDANRTREVDVDLGGQPNEILAGPGVIASDEHTRIVDEHIEIRVVGLDSRRQGSNRVGVGNVALDRFHFRNLCPRRTPSPTQAQSRHYLR